jgi:hypothetical protein
MQNWGERMFSTLCRVFGFGVLHGVQIKLVDGILGTTVGPIFTGQESRGLISNFHRAMNIDILVLGFYTVCRLT